MIKQVLVVRKDLNMRKGKIGSQCAHGATKIFFDRKTISQKKSKDGEVLGYEMTILLTPDMFEWITGIFTKICVYVNSEAELVELYRQAQEAGLPCAMIEDNGLTEFHGQLTKTVLAIGPADSSLIDTVTGHLPLL